MRLEVPADGYQKWATSLKGMLGRFACLFVAESGEDIAGFLAGRVRSLPPYFGGYPVGFISEVFVEESCRDRGIGCELVTRSVSWFKECGIRRIELQVVVNCTSSNQSGPLRLRRKRDFLPLCRVVRRPLILSPSCS